MILTPIKRALKAIGLYSRVATAYHPYKVQALRVLDKYHTRFEIAKNISFNIDKEDEDIFQLFAKRPPLIQEIDTFIRLAAGKKLLLDIGASHGIFSLTFLAKNPGAKVLAVEPSPKGLWFLRRHQKLNKDFDIKVLDYALGDKKDKRFMHFEWHHLVTNHKSGQKGVLIEYKTLDDLVAEEHMKPDIIKIDVEGFECKVLAGAKQFLQQNEPLLIIELHGDWLNNYGSKIEDLTSLLTDCGYHFYDLENNEISPASSELHQFGYKLVCSKKALS